MMIGDFNLRRRGGRSSNKKNYRKQKHARDPSNVIDCQEKKNTRYKKLRKEGDIRYKKTNEGRWH